MSEAKYPESSFLRSHHVLILFLLVGLAQGVLFSIEKIDSTEPQIFNALIAALQMFSVYAGLYWMFLHPVSTNELRRILTIGFCISALAAWVYYFPTDGDAFRADKSRQNAYHPVVFYLFILSLPLCRFPMSRQAALSNVWRAISAGAIALFFVGLCWLFLNIWARLFGMIGIDFFDLLFFDEDFIVFIMPVMVALGFYLQRGPGKALDAVLQVVSSFFNIKYPILCFLGSVFSLFFFVLLITDSGRLQEVSTAYMCLFVVLVVTISTITSRHFYQSTLVNGFIYFTFLSAPVILFFLSREVFLEMQSGEMKPEQYTRLYAFIWLLCVSVFYAVLYGQSLFRKNAFSDKLKKVNLLAMGLTWIFSLAYFLPPMDPSYALAKYKTSHFIEKDFTLEDSANIVCKHGVYGQYHLRQVAKQLNVHYAVGKEKLKNIRSALTTEPCNNIGTVDIPEVLSRLITIPENLDVPEKLQKAIDDKTYLSSYKCTTQYNDLRCLIAEVSGPTGGKAYAFAMEHPRGVSWFEIFFEDANGEYRVINYDIPEAPYPSLDEFIALLSSGALQWTPKTRYDIRLDDWQYNNRPHSSDEWAEFTSTPN